MTPERKKALQNLKTARGQIDGIIRMIEDERYCIASQTLLKKANLHILSGHLHTCVKTAIATGDSDEKLQEIEDVLAILLK